MAAWRYKISLQVSKNISNTPLKQFSAVAKEVKNDSVLYRIGVFLTQEGLLFFFSESPYLKTKRRSKINTWRSSKAQQKNSLKQQKHLAKSW